MKFTVRKATSNRFGRRPWLVYKVDSKGRFVARMDSTFGTKAAAEKWAKANAELLAPAKRAKRSNPANARVKAKVRRTVRKAVAKRTRNPRGARGYNKAVKLYRDFHGEHPRFVDEYDLPAPDVGVYVGPCDGILYTAKIDGKTERLVHEFTGKSRPIFAVSADGRDILLLGGDFQFTERGLVDGVS